MCIQIWFIFSFFMAKKLTVLENEAKEKSKQIEYFSLIVSLFALITSIAFSFYSFYKNSLLENRITILETMINDSKNK